MQEELLIECVRSREFLYNLRHPKYLDAKYKDAAWMEIGAELNTKAHKCKKRWQNIRDLYRKYRMKERTVQGGQAARTAPRKYRHWESLQFLSPYFEGRTMISSTGGSQSVKDNCEEEGSRERTTTSSTQPISNSTAIVEKEKCLDKTLGACEEILRAFIEKGTAGCGGAAKPPTTPLQEFFLSACSQVALLKPRNQSAIKLELSQLIAKYEQMEMDERGE